MADDLLAAPETLALLGHVPSDAVQRAWAARERALREARHDAPAELEAAERALRHADDADADVAARAFLNGEGAPPSTAKDAREVRDEAAARLRAARQALSLADEAVIAAVRADRERILGKIAPERASAGADLAAAVEAARVAVDELARLDGLAALVDNIAEGRSLFAPRGGFQGTPLKSQTGDRYGAAELLSALAALA